MKKVLFMSAIAAAALASCTSDEYVGQQNGIAGNGEITFGVGADRTTRAGDVLGAEAAEKLGNEFVVYGWKTLASSESDVFQNYTVAWQGNPGSTESNTHGWEYVGLTSQPIGAEGIEQSIKYWDYSASQYDFLAWSVKGNATIEEIKTDGAGEFKSKYLVFTAPTADDLAKVYVANQVTVKKDGTTATTGGTLKQEAQAYSEKVLLTFRNMAAKVRLGIYETVPGYSVKDVKFYTDASTVGDGTSTLFASSDAFATAGTVTAKFYNGTVGTENDVVVTTAASEVDSKTQFGNLTNFAGPEYKEASANYIGRASNEASLSEGTDNGWTYVFPMSATELNLKVDYTLVSKDPSGETIKVTGANAKVPANYGEWKANYAYTYLFKISDNTNGTTGDDPSDPAGLYPITFDAVVVGVQDGNTQETITTVATPSITTYQHGSMVTENNEYVAGDPIYVENDKWPMRIANTKLYTAIDLGKDKEGITEETVANYLNNDIVLTDVSSMLTNANKIPAAETIDNVEVAFARGAVKFTPENNNIYVVEYTQPATGIKYYKVIKVADIDSANATYTLAIKDGSESTIEEGGSTIITVKNGDKVVTGAKNYFTGADGFIVEETTSGEYTFTAKAGATTGTKSISLNGGTALDITVNAYEFAATSVTIAESADNTITLNLAGITAADVDAETDFAIEGSGLSISSVADGVVTIAAANGAKSGKITFSNGGVVVATADVVVEKYSIAFASGGEIINGINESAILRISLGGAPVASKDLTSVISNTDEDVAKYTTATTTAAGNLKIWAKGVGSTTIKVGSASQNIEVTNFAVTLYTDEACSTPVGAGDLNVGTYYAKFTNNGTAENVNGLKAQGCSIAKKSETGVYKVTVSATGTATLTYIYKGVTFTLVTKTVA